MQVHRLQRELARERSLGTESATGASDQGGGGGSEQDGGQGHGRPHQPAAVGGGAGLTKGSSRGDCESTSLSKPRALPLDHCSVASSLADTRQQEADQSLLILLKLLNEQLLVLHLGRNQ